MSEFISIGAISVNNSYEPKNIHGQRGCFIRTNDTSFCDACCHVKKVSSDIFFMDTLPPDRETFFEYQDSENGEKPANTDCTFMVRKQDSFGLSGCEIHESQPFGCELYHCSRDSKENKEHLLNYCLESNLISQTEYAERISKVSRK